MSENWSPNGGTVHSGNLFRRAVPVVGRPKCHLLCNLSSETLFENVAEDSQKFGYQTIVEERKK